MRAADEITQEQFAERKTPLEKEKARLNEFLNDTDHRVSRWLETAKEMFTFIRDAVEKFETGTMTTRRQILSALGSNLLVKDRKLSIDFENSLLPAQKLAGVVQQIHKGLEPLNRPIDKKEIERLYARNPKVSSILEIVRTVFAACGGEESPPRKIRNAAEPHE